MRRRHHSSEQDTFHDRAYRRARRADRGRPGVLAWFVGLGIHAAVAALLIL